MASEIANVTAAAELHSGAYVDTVSQFSALFIFFRARDLLIDHAGFPGQLQC